MKQVTLIIIFLALLILQLPSLWKDKKWKEVVTVSLLLSLSFVMSLLQSYNIELPNPHTWIDHLIRTIIPLD